MKIVRHGLSVGFEHSGHGIYMTLKVSGKLRHEDYEIMVPMLESAIAGIKSPEIKALIDATELEGWEVRAAWDDLKLGVKHGREFKKIAILGNKDWQKYVSKVGSWFISGEIKYFEDASEALEWLNA
jgi:hypothetical protein